MEIKQVLLDEDCFYSFGELCRLCGISAELALEMIDEGLVCPQGAAPVQWRFSARELHRVQAALRLQRDLGVNIPGCALALDLIEELERLRMLLRRRS